MLRFKNQKNILEKFVDNAFEKRLLKASFNNLQDVKNELCFNNFAYSIRELLSHVLARLSPAKEVKKCKWYTVESPTAPEKVNRTQRMKYATHGGISEEFILKEVNFDLDPTFKKLTQIVDLLNKYTHVSNKTLGMPMQEIYKSVDQTVEAFIIFFQTITVCREKLAEELSEAIDNTLIKQTLQMTFDEVEILSTRSTVEEFHVENIAINKITPGKIFLTVSGTVNVDLQYGSNSDLRNDDGWQTDESFPFQCDMIGDVDQLSKFNPDIDSIYVDTESFYQ